MTVTDQLKPILVDYLASAESTLTDPVGRVVRAPGREVAWDDCCDGQLYTRVMQTVPEVRQRKSAAGVQCDIIGWRATIALGVIRCAATLDSQGNPPSADEVTADGDQMTQDMAETQQAVVCSPHTLEVVQWLPLVVQGGCHGGEWQFRVRLPNCACQ